MKIPTARNFFKKTKRRKLKNVLGNS